MFIAPHFVPSMIEINKEKLEKAKGFTQLTNKSGGWCLNDKGDIVVKFNTDGKSYLITIHK